MYVCVCVCAGFLLLMTLMIALQPRLYNRLICKQSWILINNCVQTHIHTYICTYIFLAIALQVSLSNNRIDNTITKYVCVCVLVCKNVCLRQQNKQTTQHAEIAKAATIQFLQQQQFVFCSTISCSIHVCMCMCMHCCFVPLNSVTSLLTRKKVVIINNNNSNAQPLKDIQKLFVCTRHLFFYVSPG